MGFLRSGSTRAVLNFTGTTPEIKELFIIARTKGAREGKVSFSSRVGTKSKGQVDGFKSISAANTLTTSQSLHTSRCTTILSKQYLMHRDTFPALWRTKIGQYVFVDY